MHIVPHLLQSNKTRGKTLSKKHFHDQFFWLEACGPQMCPGMQDTEGLKVESIGFLEVNSGLECQLLGLLWAHLPPRPFLHKAFSKLGSQLSILQLWLGVSAARLWLIPPFLRFLQRCSSSEAMVVGQTMLHQFGCNLINWNAT